MSLVYMAIIFTLFSNILFSETASPIKAKFHVEPCRAVIRLALGVADDVTSDDGSDDSDDVAPSHNAVAGFSCLNGMDPRVAP